MIRDISTGHHDEIELDPFDKRIVDEAKSAVLDGANGVIFTTALDANIAYWNQGGYEPGRRSHQRGFQPDHSVRCYRNHRFVSCGFIRDRQGKWDTQNRGRPNRDSNGFSGSRLLFRAVSANRSPENELPQ